MKKIIQLLKEKWVEYLLEIIVIIIGIIVAFNLDARHTKNVEEDNLIVLLKKTNIHIQQKIENLDGAIQTYEKQIEKYQAALEILEEKEILKEDEIELISEAFTNVLILGIRNYDVRVLIRLSEQLPITESNLDLLEIVDNLLNNITNNSPLIDNFHNHLFSKEALLDKNILWYDSEGQINFDYSALKKSKQSVDFLIRGYRWKNWAKYWENSMLNDYKKISGLIDQRLVQLE